MAVAHLTPIEKLIRVEIDRSPPAWGNELELEYANQVWDQICADNPRYFNAPILAFEKYEPKTGVIRARVEQYKYHAVYNSDHAKTRFLLDFDACLLAVTACISRVDPIGTLYLIGKRSVSSHSYGGRWEFGPSGGVEPPKERNTIFTHELASSLAKEIHEEIGIEIDPSECVPRSIVVDSGVDSADIHFDVELDDEPDLNPNWEYDDTRWITLEDLIAWCDTKPDEIIPTTIAHARFLHTARA